MRHIVSTLFLLIIPYLISINAVTPTAGALIGYKITNLSTGNVIASHNADIHFIPASTLKCITTAAALSRLGPEAQFDTKILYTGEMADTTLYGSVIIQGSGDPSVNIGFAQFVAQSLPHDIQGDISVNGSEPHINNTVMLEDIGTEYGVGWSSFNYENNRSLVNDSMQLWTEACVINDFMIDLMGFGVKTHNSTIETGDTTLLTSYLSKPLNSLCKHMMWESDNLYAEAIGRKLSPQMLLKDALDSIAVFNTSIGLDPKDYALTDMCGLSRTNYVSPNAMTQLLKKMSHNNDYVNCFPKAGMQGTLKNFLKTGRLKGRLVLKSGSMSGILCYAGYKINQTGKPTHTIVVFINNATCRHKEMKTHIEQLLLKYF